MGEKIGTARAGSARDRAAGAPGAGGAPPKVGPRPFFAMERARVLLCVLLPLYGISALFVLDFVPDQHMHYAVVLLAYPNALVIVYVSVVNDMVREPQLAHAIAVAFSVMFWLPVAYAAGMLLDRLGRGGRGEPGAEARR